MYVLVPELDDEIPGFSELSPSERAEAAARYYYESSGDRTDSDEIAAWDAAYTEQDARTAYAACGERI